MAIGPTPRRNNGLNMAPPSLQSFLDYCSRRDQDDCTSATVSVPRQGTLRPSTALNPAARLSVLGVEIPARNAFEGGGDLGECRHNVRIEVSGRARPDEVDRGLVRNWLA